MVLDVVPMYHSLTRDGKNIPRLTFSSGWVRTGTAVLPDRVVTPSDLIKAHALKGGKGRMSELQAEEACM